MPQSLEWTPEEVSLSPFSVVYYNCQKSLTIHNILLLLTAVNVWNKNAHKLVGYTPEEVMGKNLVKEFITDEFKTAVQSVLDQALHGDETANFEFPLMTKTGVRLDVLLNATTRRDEQGNIIGVVGIGQDITGRLAQEREYSRLIDTANAPIFGVDTLGRVNVWNKVRYLCVPLSHRLRVD